MKPILPWPLRFTSWVVIATQVLLPFQGQIMAAEQDLPRSATEASDQAPAAKPSRPAHPSLPPITPPVPGPHFSDPPTDHEIFRSHVFAEPLIPFGATTTAENKALGDALLAFNARKSDDDFAPITDFLDQHPNSPWRVSVLTQLGDFFRHSGYFTKALTAWENAWEAGKGATKPQQVSERSNDDLQLFWDN